MMMTRTYFAIGRCQFNRSCHSARYSDNKSTIRSPECSSLALLLQWIATLSRAERQCRNCKRPISLKHFAPHYYDTGALYSYAADDTEIPLLGWWPDGLEHP